MDATNTSNNLMPHYIKCIKFLNNYYRYQAKPVNSGVWAKVPSMRIFYAASTISNRDHYPNLLTIDVRGHWIEKL